jgi:hypothetical protein
LEWFKEKQESIPETITYDNIVSISDRLLFEYWKDARSIISVFDEPGGGSEEEFLKKLQSNDFKVRNSRTT